ncbi:MAG: transcriptional regulator, partial [Microcystis aeruginosa Ma_OC_H_19870700_S124]
MIIAFIDFEASALENGYPIEVGYARSDGIVGAFLIKPRSEWLYLNWSSASQSIHRLPRTILNQGLDANEVLARLNVELQGCVCFATAPAFD